MCQTFYVTCCYQFYQNDMPPVSHVKFTLNLYVEKEKTTGNMSNIQSALPSRYTFLYCLKLATQ